MRDLSDLVAAGAAIISIVAAFQQSTANSDVIVTTRHARPAVPVVRLVEGQCEGHRIFVESRVDGRPRTLRVGYGPHIREHTDTAPFVRVLLQRQEIAAPTLLCEPDGGFQLHVVAANLSEGGEYRYTNTHFTPTAEFRVQYGPTRLTASEVRLLFEEQD